jgi:hypothetical protein
VQYEQDANGNKRPVIVDIGTAERAGAAPAQTPQLTPDQSKLIPSVNPKIDHSEATGFAGRLKTAFNILAGQAGKTPFPEAEKAWEALNTLQTRTVTQLTAAIPGRETNEMRKRLEALTVEPGAFTQPDGRAKAKLEQTASLLDAEIAKLEQNLTNGGLTRTQQGVSRQNLNQLYALRKDYQTVLGNFDGGPARKALTNSVAPGGGPAGVRWRFKGETEWNGGGGGEGPGSTGGGF